MRVNDPHAMGTGCDEFGDGVSEGAGGIHVEDWDGVLPIVHTAFGEYDGDEMYARGAKEGKGGGFCKELVHVR